MNTNRWVVERRQEGPNRQVSIFEDGPIGLGRDNPRMYIATGLTDERADYIIRVLRAHDELLAALESVREWCDLIEQNYPEMLFTKAVRAAITKATGQPA